MKKFLFSGINHHWITAELLQNNNWITAELLNYYHWITAELLQDYHWITAALLPQSGPEFCIPIMPNKFYFTRFEKDQATAAATVLRQDRSTNGIQMAICKLLFGPDTFWYGPISFFMLWWALQRIAAKVVLADTMHSEWDLRAEKQHCIQKQQFYNVQ